MLGNFKKIISLCKRDGVVYTFKRVIAWSIAHSPLAYKVSFRYYNNLRLVFAPSLLTYGLFASSSTRDNDNNIIEKYLSPGGTMIDVGAHIGSLALIAARKVGPSGSVLAFEPSPKFFKIIQKNISLNRYEKNITAHQVALGNGTGEIYLNENVADDTTNHIAISGTPVKQATLDSYTTDITTINLLKIDVEGYEQAVLEGASQTLSKTKIIYIEFISTILKDRGSLPRTVIGYLEKYFILYTDEGNSRIPFCFDDTQEYETNLIGMAKEI